MDTLNLNARPLTTRPASAFPDWADVYTCDKCGCEVTRQFHPPVSHSWPPMGHETFVCRCGQRYLTGAMEWDHLSSSERRRRVGLTLFLGAILSLACSALASLVYLVLRFAFGLTEAAVSTAIAVTALPFFLSQASFWSGVIASVWRTRVETRSQVTS